MDLTRFAGDVEVASAGGELGRAVAGAHLQRLKSTAARALGRPIDELLLADREVRKPDPFADIFGAGVVLQPEGPRPALFVHERLVAEVPREGPLRPLSEFPAVREVLESRIQGFHDGTLLGTLVAPLPPVTPQYGPGGEVDWAGTHGTLGALVTTSDGLDGILTAGHLAPAGAVVKDIAGAPADIVFSTDPAQVAAGTVTADVAVAVPHSSSSWTSGVAIAGLGQVKAGDRVILNGAVSGTPHSMVWAAASEFMVSKSAGLWADVYMTEAAFSTGGDSGGPVTLESHPELVVGHLVGASGSFTSLIQDIDIQLKVTATTLR